MSSLRALSAVVQREVMERRLLLAAALLLGLVPLLVPILPRLGTGNVSDLRGATALALAGTFGAVVALMLGGSVIARDLAERRFSFYFSRPLPGWTIWAGKLAAGAVLVLGGATLVLLPVLLMGDRVDPSGSWGFNQADAGEAFLLAASALLFLLLVGHAAGVMLRSRSPWLILDLLAFLIAGWLLLDSTHVLEVVGARTASILLLIAVLCLILFALFIAGAVQVVRGRTDLQRSHRLLSLTLWGILLPLALGAQGVSRWVTSVTPRHLEEVEAAVAAPAGDWIYVQGKAVRRGDYSPAFLLDTSTGAFLQVPRLVTTALGNRMTFSADGRRVAWASSDPRNPMRIDTVDLTHPEAGVIQTPISLDRPLACFALSKDGGRLATMSQGRLRVDEIPSGKMVASVRLPWEHVESVQLISGDDVLQESPRLLFDKDVIRILAVPYHPLGARLTARMDRVLQIYEYNLRSKELAKTGEIDLNNIGWELAKDDDTHRLVVRNGQTSSFQVHNVRTGELKMAVPVDPLAAIRASLLTGDRLALAIQRHGHPDELRVYAGSGALLRRLRFDGNLILGGQPSPETLVVASGSATKASASWLVDLDTGKVKRIGDELRPFIWRDLRPGSIGTKLFTGTAGRLVGFDPLTGQQRVVLPGQG